MTSRPNRGNTSATPPPSFNRDTWKPRPVRSLAANSSRHPKNPPALTDNFCGQGLEMKPLLFRRPTASRHSSDAGGNGRFGRGGRRVVVDAAASPRNIQRCGNPKTSIPAYSRCCTRRYAAAPHRPHRSGCVGRARHGGSSSNLATHLPTANQCDTRPLRIERIEHGKIVARLSGENSLLAAL